jgi:peptidoglycan L-alanyl-D-glutamate endopeptidase CwlK
MASRKLSDLHPLIQPHAQAFIDDCKSQGIDILVTCTWRSHKEQDELYAIGRTKPGRKVTNARAGQSAHNFTINDQPASKALDVVPLRHGKPVWGTSGNGIDNDPTDDDKDDLELWQRVGAIAKCHGFEWAGDWKVFKEFPHLEMKI